MSRQPSHHISIGRTASLLALLLLACAAALASAGSASAALTPQLVVSGTPPPGAGPGTAITVKAAAGDDPVARVAIAVPPGYKVTTAAAAGTRLGSVAAHAVAPESGGAVLPLTGDVLTAAPSKLAAQAAQCGAAPVAVWNLHLTGAGQALDVPVFVVANADPATPPDYTLLLCLPASGARLIDLSLTVNALTSPSAAGEYRWRSLWTPYAPDTGLPDEAATVETQSLVRLPTQLIVSARRSKVVRGGRTWTRVTLAGQLAEAGKGVEAAQVSILTGRSATKLTRSTTVTTDANGSFAFSMLVRAGTWFRAETTFATRDLGSAGCVQSPAPATAVPCGGATVAGAHLFSTKVKVYAFG